MESIMEGFQSDINAQQVLSQLANVSQPIKNNSERPSRIYGGDLVIAVDILVKLAKYNGNQGNVSSAEDFKNYAQVASNLLESTNSRTWKELEKVSLLFAVDRTFCLKYFPQPKWPIKKILVSPVFKRAQRFISFPVSKQFVSLKQNKTKQNKTKQERQKETKKQLKVNPSAKCKNS